MPSKPSHSLKIECLFAWLKQHGLPKKQDQPDPQVKEATWAPKSYKRMNEYNG